MQNLKKTLFTLLAVSVLAACGGNGNDDEDTGTSDTGQQEDTATMDAGSDAGADTDEGDDDTSTADTSTDEDTSSSDDGGSMDGIPLNSFVYRQIDQGGQSTRSGVSVNSLAGQPRIEKFDNNSVDCSLDSEDVDTITQDVITETVRKKLHPDHEESFECGSDDGGGVTYEFEAKLGSTLDAPQPVVDITGCVPDDSEAADATLVQEIVDQMTGMRDKYFEQRECHKSN